MKVYPVEFLERCLKLTILLVKKQFESEMCTAPRRERRFVQNEDAAQARARWHVRSGHAGLGRRTKNIGCS